MGIYIKGIEMPISCSDCKLRMMVGCCGNLPYNTRMPNCHLVPVPEHGKLIDADTLWVEINHICDKRDNWLIDELTCLRQILSAIRHAPTVIQASKEGKSMIRFPKDCWHRNCEHLHVTDMSVDELIYVCDAFDYECDAGDVDYCHLRCPLAEKEEEEMK